MMYTIISIFVTLFILMFLVVIHEFGHFWTAKKSWVKVLEFGIWIPPKIYKYKTDESGTDYTINAIPLGGFVRLKWEDPKDTEDFNAPDSFIMANFWKKTAILLAGIFMNFAFAWIVLTMLFTFWTKPFAIIPENWSNIKLDSFMVPTIEKLQNNWFIKYDWEQTLVSTVITWSLADRAWILSGDIILSINDIEVNNLTITKELSKNIWNKINISYIRDWQTKNTSLDCPEENCIIWIISEYWEEYQKQIKDLKIKFPIHIAMLNSFKEIYTQTALTFSIMWKFALNIISFDQKEIKSSVDKFSGPVAMVKLFEKTAETGDFFDFLLITVMISIALGAFNLLPIPALDGWRLLGVIIQTVFRLPKDKYFNIEWYINMIFFVLLMWLWIFIMIKDYIRFW